MSLSDYNNVAGNIKSIMRKGKKNKLMLEIKSRNFAKLQRQVCQQITIAINLGIIGNKVASQVFSNVHNSAPCTQGMCGFFEAHRLLTIGGISREITRRWNSARKGNSAS